MSRIEDFKKDLIALLVKYDAQISVEQKYGIIHSDEEIKVTFNSIWENERVCIDEYREVFLGTSVVP